MTVVHIHAEKLHYARVSYSELLPTSLFTIGCLGFVHIGHMSDYKYVGFQRVLSYEHSSIESCQENLRRDIQS